MEDAFSREGVGRWLRGQFLDALLEGDAAEAERIARDGLDAGLHAPLLYSEVVAPAMREIGERWVRAEITVADEHLATSIATRVVALAGHLGDIADRRPDARVLAATVDGEQHVLGLQMAVQILEDAGYEVLMLGASLPADALRAAVERHRPAIVALSATMPAHARALREAVGAVHGAHGAHAGVVAGGAASQRVGPASERLALPELADVVEAADALRLRPGLN